LRLWGKVVSGMMLFIAAVFAVIAAVVPEARSASVIIVLILIALALFGIPALVRLFTSFTGDEEILTSGVAGSATITSLKPTGWRYNRYYPIVRFTLKVEAGGAAYPVEIKQAVDPERLGRFTPGDVIKVRVHRSDHKKVVIDWSESKP
jgi:hypothetical protein